MMRYIASCSGGKDSVATVILAHEHNEPLDEVIFAEVMFSQNISGELPEHIDFIKNVAFPMFREWGYKTTVVRADTNFISCFFHMITQSKIPERNGKLKGFPLQRRCVIQGYCKVSPIRKYLKQIDDEIVQYIGIASDEPERLERMKDGTVSLLEKYHLTEADAKDLCIKYGLLSPTYEFSKRGGCWFCPNARDEELRHLRTHHNELWKILIALESMDSEMFVTANDGNQYFSLLNKISVCEKEKQFQFEDSQIKFWEE